VIYFQIFHPHSYLHV